MEDSLLLRLHLLHQSGRLYPGRSRPSLGWLLCISCILPHRSSFQGIHQSKNDMILFVHPHSTIRGIFHSINYQTSASREPTVSHIWGRLSGLRCFWYLPFGNHQFLSFHPFCWLIGMKLPKISLLFSTSPHFHSSFPLEDLWILYEHYLLTESFCSRPNMKKWFFWQGLAELTQIWLLFPRFIFKTIHSQLLLRNKPSCLHF